MDERSALLRTILETPNDDTPRLVYADYLEEHGGAFQADFIRHQIASGEATTQAGSICEILGAVTAHDLGTSLFSGSGADSVFSESITWRRGFIEKVRCRERDWIRFGPVIINEQPVAIVSISDREPYEWTTANGHPYFTWYQRSLVDSPTYPEIANIADEIFKLIDGNIFNQYWMTYESRGEASTALSLACLAWAKSQPIPDA